MTAEIKLTEKAMNDEWTTTASAIDDNDILLMSTDKKKTKASGDGDIA